MTAPDLELIKTLADAAGNAAGSRIAAEMRADSKRLKEELREDLRAEFRNHFGQMDPAKHIISHDRIDRILKIMDRLGDNIVGKILQNLIIGILVLSVVGYAFWIKFTGGSV